MTKIKKNFKDKPQQLLIKNDKKKFNLPKKKMHESLMLTQQNSREFNCV